MLSKLQISLGNFVKFRISAILYIQDHMKQIEYIKHATYICAIHSKCYMVSRTSVILYTKQDHMKQIEYDKTCNLHCAIHCKCYMVLQTLSILYIYTTRPMVHKAVIKKVVTIASNNIYPVNPMKITTPHALKNF